jgi:hypothetical protein
MKNTDILNRIMTMLSSKVELKQMTLEDGTIIECATYEVGSDVFKVDGDTKEALPVGEYILEDGSKLYVTETGKIGEIASAETEIVEEELKETKEELGNDNPKEEEKMAEVPATLEEIVKSVMDAVMPIINDLQAKIEAMSGIETEMKEVKETLSSKIVSKPTTHKPTESKTNLSNLKVAPNLSETQARIYAMLSK